MQVDDHSIAKISSDLIKTMNRAPSEHVTVFLQSAFSSAQDPSTPNRTSFIFRRTRPVQENVDHVRSIMQAIEQNGGQILSVSRVNRTMSAILSPTGVLAVAECRGVLSISSVDEK